ncbi:hypothetical protein PTKIN_Ptkin09bG0016700 [Pterospermum kingtungense]
MASQRDQQHLKKVGLEGFELIDACYGRQSLQRLQSSQPQVRQSHYQYFYNQHQQSYVCQVPQVYTVIEEPVTSYPGTSQHHYYGGRGVSERPQVSVVEESVLSSNEAAQLCGGTMIIDYSKNRPLRRAYY